MTMTMQELARQENLAVRNSWRAGAFDQREIEAEIMARIPESWYGPARKKYRVRKKPKAWEQKSRGLEGLEAKRLAYCRPQIIWVL